LYNFSLTARGIVHLQKLSPLTYSRYLPPFKKFEVPITLLTTTTTKTTTSYKNRI
jgi:hypothetical protein